LRLLPHGLLARTHTAPAFSFKSRALGSPSLIILAYEHSEQARAPQHAKGLSSSLHGNRGGATAAAAGNRSSRGATAASRCGATANSDQRSRASCAPSADRPAKASEGIRIPCPFRNLDSCPLDKSSVIFIYLRLIFYLFHYIF